MIKSIKKQLNKAVAAVMSAILLAGLLSTGVVGGIESVEAGEPIATHTISLNGHTSSKVCSTPFYSDDKWCSMAAVRSDGSKVGSGNIEINNTKYYGIKMENATVLTLSIPGNVYAQITTKSWSRSAGNATEIKLTGGNISGATADTGASATDVTDGIFSENITPVNDTGDLVEYTIVKTSTTQLVLHELTINVYASESDFPSAEATYTVSGVIASDVDLSGGTVNITNTDKVTKVGDITGATENGYSFSVEGVPAGTYSVTGVNSNGLNEAKKLVSVMAGSVIVSDKDVTDAELSVDYKSLDNIWDFAKEDFESYTVQYTSEPVKGAIYKGLTINCETAGKFAVNSDNVQFNNGTEVVIPVNPAKAGTVTVEFSSSANYTLGDKTFENGEKSATYKYSKGTESVSLISKGSNYISKISYEEEEDTTPSVTLTSGSLTLDGTIGINFYFKVSNVDVSAAKAVLTSGDDKKIVNLADVKADGNGEYCVTYNLAAKQANQDVTIKFTDNDDNSITTYNSQGTEIADGYTFSVSKYNEALSDESPTKELVKAVQNYGDLAKDYFSGTTTATAPAVAASDVESYTPVKSGAGITYTGSSLVIKSDTSIKHYFSESLDDYEVTCNDTLPEGVTLEKGDNYVAIRNIPAKNLADTYTIKLTKGGNSYTISYSALSYVQVVLNKYEGTETKASLQNVVKGIYKYYEAAAAYFAG